MSKMQEFYDILKKLETIILKSNIKSLNNEIISFDKYTMVNGFKESTKKTVIIRFFITVDDFKRFQFNSRDNFKSKTFKQDMKLKYKTKWKEEIDKLIITIQEIMIELI